RPTCPDPKHAKYKVRPNGTYTTAGGERQRYRCYDPDNPEVTKHTFTTPLPRSAVSEETCCPDCEVPTPKHAGAEAPTRRMSYPASVIYSVLHDLAEGRAYTYASMRALEEMRRPTGRSRKVKDKSGQIRTPDELNDAGLVSPDREQKAHWHIAADILERFGPVITEPAFETIRAEEAQYRTEGLPVVYVADEVPVKRDYARSFAYNDSPVVWNALVVSRMKWEQDRNGNLVGRSSKLVRVRALPNVTKEAWSLVLSELDAPDFLIADGAAAIEQAALSIWGSATTFVPCVYHATTNIRRRIAPKGLLPEKVRDHLFTLTREEMVAHGSAAVTSWFNELEQLADSAGLAIDPVLSLRTQYEPLLARSALVAQTNNKPKVPISNASVENQIDAWVAKLTRRRGAMFANLGRTNLLGDLIVAGANGALLRQHDVVQALRDASRKTGGWSPPPRALVEPAGTYALRDAASVTELLRQVSA
ncbi:MAG: hypothetical protein HHJ13_05535, partial [Phycicoccus sp.]|nr:hypothetical protein [Phycicoccus sp.]